MLSFYYKYEISIALQLVSILLQRMPLVYLSYTTVHTLRTFIAVNKETFKLWQLHLFEVRVIYLLFS